LNWKAYKRKPSCLGLRYTPHVYIEWHSKTTNTWEYPVSGLRFDYKASRIINNAEAPWIRWNVQSTHSKPYKKTAVGGQLRAPTSLSLQGKKLRSCVVATNNMHVRTKRTIAPVFQPTDSSIFA